jgi:predicted deacylase
MKSELKVEGVVAKSGTAAYGFLEVGEMQDGTAARLPVAIVNGAEDGPILYIQAASDGDELNGIAVIHHLLNTISPEELRGGIIAVPIVNIFAFHFKQSYSIADGRKMNRCFPGKKSGTSSERIAYKLFREAVLQSQYCIDLHQGSVRPMVDSLNVRVSRRHRLHKKCMEMARVFGIGYILDERGPKGQLAQAAPDKGIPTIDPELGGCHGWDETSVQKGIKGVQNVLRYYGFLDGDPEIPEQQVVVRKFQGIENDRGGFIKYRAKMYDLLEYRDPVADICDAFGRTVETITAPRKGILWSVNLYPMVPSGSRIGTLGVDISYI